jgi:hypothetical protein
VFAGAVALASAEISAALMPPGGVNSATDRSSFFCGFRSTGPLGPDEMADMIFNLFLNGLKSVAPVGRLRSSKA